MLGNFGPKQNLYFLFSTPFLHPSTPYPKTSRATEHCYYAKQQSYRLLLVTVCLHNISETGREVKQKVNKKTKKINW